MNAIILAVALIVADPLGPGDHERTIRVDGRDRSCLVHVPDGYDADEPTPVVLVLHGAGTNARFMVGFTGMSGKSDEAGFIVVYPNGTGVGAFLTFNSGGLMEGMAKAKPDDVKFVAALLDHLATVVNVDPRRIYAAGFSNGGMMCYRLAAELADRIAAIAPVSGTMAIEDAKPARPVPVMHFHGTADRIVPFGGPGKGTPKFIRFQSVEETLRTWAKLNRCEKDPMVEELEDRVDDGTRVTKKAYTPAAGGAEVVLFEIEGAGHTWPGRRWLEGIVGKSTRDITANDLIWEFFRRHPMPLAGKSETESESESESETETETESESDSDSASDADADSDSAVPHPH